MHSSGSQSLLSRPLDLLYFGYFASHIPVTLLVDLQSLYPKDWIPQVLQDVLAWYLALYKDPILAPPTPFLWFQSFVLCEALLQLPFFFVACYGLSKNSSSIRLPMIVYGAHVATTVIPCIAETVFNQHFELTQMERLTLCGFYLPYFIIPCIMMIDSYRRVSKALMAKKTSKSD
ncbi:transmembrane protein 6/97 [Dichotomocladium elegans]|nr:transmembrane protein 6/97 [Dichotomocladium elegans]